MSFGSAFRLYWSAIILGSSVSVVHSEPIQVVSQIPPQLVNRSSVVLVGIRCGQTTVSRLDPGASASLPVDGCSETPVGRVELSSWAQALDQLSPAWAPYHLRTAGHLLDALDMGPAGEPGLSVNIAALAQVTQEIAAQWTRGGPLRLALVARAAEHAPVHLLQSLLPRTDPHMNHQNWSEGYRSLPSTADSIRSAIEAHGIAAVPMLLKAPAWAADRGFSNPRLALAFPSIRRHVKAVLTSNGTNKKGESGVEERIRVFAQAHEAGDQKRLVDLAIESAILTNEPRQAWDHAVEQRLACGGLDSGARIAIGRGQWLAAFAYLNLAVRLCGDMPAVRSRIAELFRRRGEADFERVRLLSAASWFESALWFAGEAGDRARLADTLAELAIFRFREESSEIAAEYLARAKDLDPFRPRVLEAGRFKPTVDSRARFGVIVIILFLGFFAIRRLKRALFDDLKDRR